jgi:hypothetical protein
MMMKTPLNDDTEYLELIQSIDAFRVQIPDPEPRGRQLMIRHDVDHDIDQALDMARYEELYGIRSTYFLLHTASYFKFGDTLIKKLREFKNLGHSVGLHNNMLALWIKDYDNPDAEVDQFDIYTRMIEIAAFFKSAGIRLIGTSAHGDKLCHERGFLNYELWDECPGEKRAFGGHPEHTHPQFSLREFGFEYEAYFLRRDVYLSDTGHTWYGSKGKGIGDFEIPHDNIGKDEAIKQFNDRVGGKCRKNI